MSKFTKINVNEIRLDSIREEYRKELEKEKDTLNSIDNLFTLVIVLVLALTFVSHIIASSQYSYFMAIGYGIGVISIVYIRYARTKHKAMLRHLIEIASLGNIQKPIKIVNYHEKAHTAAMYIMLISLTLSLINSILEIMMK
ncbi:MULTISPECIES: hypothetical protein [Staphylococcus]|uniref:hypothetical protein n=1 Tax=Staphylococcus TaxID=1279 RepID=UPI00044B8A63|nr:MULTISPECIES: hypothetical protein [Staphylococcus]EZW50451.1 hypothetical protein U970_02504 [Staphylococcus aureus 56824-10]GBY66382.1 hypothetical protein M6K074_2786 [Staphylococcus aureus]GBY66427.1 hypothetical protein M6K074_2831 [Staphylococcus aureus]